MKRYIRSRAGSFYFAFKGVKTLVTTQPNMVIHLVFTGMAIGAGFYYEISRGEWLAIVAAIALVWVTESVNTAIEFLTDLVSPDYHPLAGKVKDVAAAAVLFAAAFSVVVGLIVFWPKVF